MRYPSSLPAGGTIGFVAPSFGCATEPYRTAFVSAQKKFTEMGYGLDPGPNCYKEEGVGISNTPAACGAELTEYYCRKDNDVLISCGGGELMCESMSHVDFERVKAAEPKWYMGYSDNTNMTYLLATLADTASVYGPCAAAFGMEPWHEALTDAFGILTGDVHAVHSYPLWERESAKSEENPTAPYHVTESTTLRTTIGHEAVPADAEVTMSGRLLGGCVDCLVNLLGTRFDRTTEFVERYKDDGILWFLECCDLNVFAMRRAMWQMKEAGWFAHVKGFLIGRPLAYGQEMMGLDQYEAILAVAGEFGVPVVMDADIGHLPPMMPVVCGSVATVSVRGKTLQMAYDFR